MVCHLSIIQIITEERGIEVQIKTVVCVPNTSNFWIRGSVNSSTLCTHIRLAGKHPGYDSVRIHTVFSTIYIQCSQFYTYSVLNCTPAVFLYILCSQYSAYNFIQCSYTNCLLNTCSVLIHTVFSIQCVHIQCSYTNCLLNTCSALVHTVFSIQCI